MKTKIILIDSSDRELYGIIESDEYSISEIKNKIIELKNKWYLEDEGYLLMEYLEEKLLNTKIIRAEDLITVEV